MQIEACGKNIPVTADLSSSLGDIATRPTPPQQGDVPTIHARCPVDKSAGMASFTVEGLTFETLATMVEGEDTTAKKIQKVRAYLNQCTYTCSINKHFRNRCPLPLEQK